MEKEKIDKKENSIVSDGGKISKELLKKSKCTRENYKKKLKEAGNLKKKKRISSFLVWELCTKFYLQALLMCMLRLSLTLMHSLVTIFSKKLIKSVKSDTSISAKEALLLQSCYVIGLLTVYNLNRSSKTYLTKKSELKISSFLKVLIHQKSLNISLRKDPIFKKDEILQLSIVDVKKGSEIFTMATFLLFRPLETLIFAYWLYDTLDHNFHYYWFLLVLVAYLHTSNSEKNIKAGKKLNKGKVSMSKLFRNVFNHIENIKMNVLESYFLKKLDEKKLKVIETIRKDFDRNSISSTFNKPFIPFLFSSIVLSIVLYHKGNVDTLAVFTIFRLIPKLLNNFRRVFYDYGDLKICLNSLKRIAYFLFMDEIERYEAPEGFEEDTDVVIEVQNGSFYWHDDQRVKASLVEKKTQLELGGIFAISPSKKKINKIFFDNNIRKKEILAQNLNFKIKRGEMVALVGPVGSGKTTIFDLLLNEMNSSLDSKLGMKGKVSIVSQKPWLMNNTIKWNIIFGSDYDEERYKKAIELSCLYNDFSRFSKGDQTMIQVGGKNLSGGQKLRISLARAFYSDSDVYLLDDPLTSLDHEVSSKVQEFGIKEYLRGKTRLVISSSTEFMEDYDRILLVKNGRIIADGDFAAIKDHPDFKSLSTLCQYKSFNSTVSSMVTDFDEADFKHFSKKKRKGSFSLQKSFNPDTFFHNLSASNVKSLFKVFRTYISYILPKQQSTVYLFNLLVFVAVTITSKTILKIWKDKSNSSSILEFILIYSMLNLALGLTTFLRFSLVYTGHCEFLKFLNKKISENLLQGSFQNFYGKIKMSSLLMVLSKDIASVDSKLANKTVKISTTM